MLNLYEDIRSNLHFNKFEIGDLIFVEYTCPIETNSLGIWTHTDYLVHVISGKKIWHTTNGSWTAETGQTLFFKKGAAVIEQFFDEDFCLLLFFIPDDFVREIVIELVEELKKNSRLVPALEPIIHVHEDAALSAFLQSMVTYFSSREKPSELILKLKLKELIVSLLVSRSNPALSAYFQSLVNREALSVAEIMESNFRYNLSLQDFAELCHKSLSSFKRDFRKHYDESPGRWLLKKRLDYSAALLRAGDMNITDVVFESGFEDHSHFSKAFKEQFGMSPTAFRNDTTVLS